MWFWAVIFFTAMYGRNSEALFSLIFVIICIKEFGSSCVTPSQETGRCDSLFSCDILCDLLQTEDPEIQRYLKNSLCGWNGSIPLVCCGTRTPYSGEPVEGITTPSDTQVSTLLPGKDKCGYQQVPNKIIGGSETGLEEFPWMALLEYYSNKTGERKFRCGGALISKRYILTAAHCVRVENLTLVGVRLGEWNIETRNDCVGGRFNRKCVKAVDMEIEEVKQHENYHVYKTELPNDIALIRLKEEVKFADHIQPICLPENAEEKSNPGESLWVSGWGTTDASIRKNSIIKQKVLVPVVPMRRCKERYDRYKGIQLTDAQLCAGGEWGKDSCRGDSGGPLMATRVDDPSQSYIEGIVSFGTRNCARDMPGVYTRVSVYLDWIKRNIKP